MIKKYKVLFGVMLGLFILIFGVSCCVIGIADCNVEKNYFAGGAIRISPPIRQWCPRIAQGAFSHPKTR